MTIRVLIADDHAMMRDGLQALLEGSPDIEVVGTAANGREAVRLGLELHPDVIIMDVEMPDLNGIEAAHQLRERSPETCVVMLSMHSSAEHVYRALEAGAAGYLLKESAGKEAAAAVRAVRAGRRYLSSALEQARREAGPRITRVSPLDSLSARERQVLQLVVEGRSSAEIAKMVHLSPKSVETYRSRLMKKLGVGDITALVKFAVRHGITTSA
ncbi:MAG: response regulator transcription factor [Betaproteobacteria bacterium]